MIPEFINNQVKSFWNQIVGQMVLIEHFLHFTVFSSKAIQATTLLWTRFLLRRLYMLDGLTLGRQIRFCDKNFLLRTLVGNQELLNTNFLVGHDTAVPGYSNIEKYNVLKILKKVIINCGFALAFRLCKHQVKAKPQLKLASRQFIIRNDLFASFFFTNQCY